MAGILNRQRASMIAAQVAVVLGVLLAWHTVARMGVVDPGFFGSPAGVADRLWHWVSDGSLAGHVLSTLGILLTGFLIGSVAGCALGAWIGLSPTAHDVIEPFLIFFNGMPRLILQPFFIIWLGFGFASKVALVVAVIIILVAVGIASALKDIDKDLVANVRILGGNRREMAWNVYLPSLTLAIAATSRTNIGFAFQAALVAEFVGTTSGLGYLIVKGQNLFDIDTIWAALVVVIALATVLDHLISRIEARATRWMPQAS